MKDEPSRNVLYFFALLVKTVSRQEAKNIRFCIFMLLLTPSGVILRSFGAQLRKSKYLYMVRSTLLVFPIISEKSSLESANESVDGKPRKLKKYSALLSV